MWIKLAHTDNSAPVLQIGGSIDEHNAKIAALNPLPGRTLVASIAGNVITLTWDKAPDRPMANAATMAPDEHEAFLAEQGALPEQIKKRKR